jgi:hypothetical protein
MNRANDEALFSIHISPECDMCKKLNKMENGFSMAAQRQLYRVMTKIT